jgi:hypothetical protein
MDNFRVEITWRYLKDRSSFDLQEQVVQAWAKVATPRLLTVTRAPFKNTWAVWKRSMILPCLHLRRLAYSPLDEAQLRALEAVLGSWWYVPLRTEYDGVY